MSKKTILVVEDDADVRLVYRVLLEAHNYGAFFAADSGGAISEARSHLPDLILLDLGLPAGDAFVVLERFRTTILGMIPVIVVSARDPHQNKERALKAGASAYLQKPWNDEELLDTIKSLLGEPAAVLQHP